MTHIEELSDIVNRLKLLLDDPHPGLFTWRRHYNETVKEFFAFFDDPHDYQQRTKAQEIWDAAVQQTIGDMERSLHEHGAMIPISIPGGVLLRRI